MNYRTHDPEVCEDIRMELAEFALGTLSGRDRAQVLEHLDSCPGCSAEMASLSSVADSMLQLAPEADPTPGFELRIVERLNVETPHRSRRRVRGIAQLAAAAVLLAALGVGGGFVLGNHRGASPSTALLAPNGRDLGQVFVTTGSPSWIYMIVGDDNWSGVVSCRVVLKNGVTETVGSFALAGGYGAWSAEVNAAGSQVKTAQVVDAHGGVIASATLSS
jgi:predicted anti-sigma-YlaC factor YlaD